MKQKNSKKLNKIFPTKPGYNAWKDNPVYEAGETLIYPEEDEPINKVKENEVEVGSMRYDVNSDEAFEAYKKMVLIDYVEDDFEMAHDAASLYCLKYEFTEEDQEALSTVLDALFSIDGIEATNEYDENIISDMLDARIQFFGTDDSRFTQSISFAEVIIYWCRKIEFNFGYSLSQWAWEIINNLELLRDETDGAKLQETIAKVMTNEFYASSGFGLFGLKSSEPGFTQVGMNGRMNDQFNTYMQRLSEYENDGY